MANQAVQYPADIAPPDDIGSSSDNLQKEGYYKGSMHLNIPGQPQPKSQKYDNDAAAAIVSQYESGGKNIPNYRYDVGHTASGIYQITDTNWHNYAPKLGIDTRQYPTAMSAPSNLQRSVFDVMYSEQGFAPWAPYNPRLADAIGEGKLATPGWVPSPQAYDTEDKKSNTSLRYMDPLQYLSLLPPLENDEANESKKNNLKQSLSKGDNIEDLPSLEVEAKGNDLKIVDHDGRNRALAAIDAGVDRIPVAINGALEDKDYKNLIGKKKLPYNEFKPVPPNTVPQDVAKFAPNSIPNINPGQLQEQTRAQNQPQIPIANQAPVPTKPDYYPQIVAGVNNDIYNPRGIGYRGTGIPDLATNATASGRINAANSTSAGQVGLTPSSPTSSMMNMLSNLNPIGSANAAETQRQAAQYPNNIPLPPDINNTLQATGNIPPPPPEPQGYIPHVPGLDTIAPPLANALTSPAVNLVGDIAGLFSKPNSMNAFMDSRANTINRLNIPETPVGQAISSIIGSPARLVGWAAEKILGEDLANKVKPYATIGMDLLAPLALASSPIRNALSRPVTSTLNKIIKNTPETRAALEINKTVPSELARSGMSQQDMVNKIDLARNKNIPVTIADLSARGGPLESLLTRSLENTPEGVASAEKFLKERIEGVRPTPSSEPVGGTLARMTKEIENHFGSGSARDAQDALDKSFKANSTKLNDTQNKLNKVNQDLNKHVNLTSSDVKKEARLKAQQTKLSSDANDLRKQITTDTNNSRALQFGQRVLRDSTRVEDIDNFLNKRPRTISNDELDNFKLGISDAIRHEYRKVRQLGQEPNKTVLPENIRNKISTVFNHNRAAADDFLNTVDAEDLISQRTKDITGDIRREGRISELNKRKFRFILESAGHLAAHLLWSGHGVFSPLYWAIKGGRQISDFLSTGGGSAAKHTKVVNALLDPNARVNPTGNLLNVPSRNALSQQRIGNVSNALVGAGVLSGTTNNQPNTRFATPQEMAQ